jgi:hypothetical protein
MIDKSKIEKDGAKVEWVFEQGGKWYFWTEDGSDYIGPYDTKADAEAGLQRYAENLDNMHVE